MSLFKRAFGPTDAGGPAAEPSADATPDWREYRAGKGDRAGRRIRNIYAVDDEYVIYFIGCEMFYELTPALREHLGAAQLGAADALLARINRLLEDDPRVGTREYNLNISTLELASDGLEMLFSGEKAEALQILNGILDKLQAQEEAKRRLMYQAGAVLVTVLVWVFYLSDPLAAFSVSTPSRWEPWVLAAVLAMAGGLFSVCLTIGSLEVNVNQGRWFLLSAGATRSVVAFLAGAAVLLAMRSKMFAGIVYEGDPPAIGQALQITEMFFCFIAGFSESFVPNILRDATRKAEDTKAAPPAATNAQHGGEQRAPEKAQPKTRRRPRAS